MDVTEAIGIPCIRITTIATSSRLSMVKSHIMTLVVTAGPAGMAEDASLIGLASSTDPDNVVSLEGMLTYAARGGNHVTEVSQKYRGGHLHTRSRLLSNSLCNIISEHPLTQ